jgi:hypothetical protein
MAIILKQSTQVIVRIGPFVDVGDGFTPQTDITLGGNEAELLKAGSVEVDISARTWAAVTNCRGWYDLTLTTDDTDTVGELVVVVQDDSDCLPVFMRFQVVEEAVYTALFAASAPGPLTAAAAQAAATASIVAHNLDHLCLTATVAADMTAEVADNTILSRLLANGDTSAFVPSTDGLQLIRDKLTDIETDTNELQTDDVPTLIAALPTAVEIQAEMEENGASILDTLRDDLADGGRLDLLVDAIKAKTDNLPADPADASVIAAAFAVTDGKIDTAQTDLDTLTAHSDVLLAGTASAGSATTITLTGGVATAGLYDGCVVVITGGTGAGQARTILSYAATTIAAVTRDFVTNPAADSVFIVVAGDTPAVLEAGTATGGGASAITLDAGASAISATYKSNHIMITAGTGIGQTRLITNYVGATKVATVTPAWTTQPVAGSVYQIVAGGRVDVGEWLGEVIPEATINGVPEVDVTHWLGTACSVPSAAGVPSVDVLTIENADPTDTINAEVDSALADIHLDHLLAADYDPASKPGVATALLNELVENDGGVSRFTENSLEQAPSGTGASAATIADAVWDEAKAGHTAAGSFGEEEQSHALTSEVAAVQAKTDNLPTDPADASVIAAAFAATDALIAALNNLSAAQVNAEVVDALATDTYAEPGQEAPGTTISLATKINYIYKFMRNKIISNATTIEVYNDAGAVVDQKATHSDDGTDYTRGEFGSGP